MKTSRAIEIGIKTALLMMLIAVIVSSVDDVITFTLTEIGEFGIIALIIGIFGAYMGWVGE